MSALHIRQTYARIVHELVRPRTRHFCEAVGAVEMGSGALRPDATAPWVPDLLACRPPITRHRVESGGALIGGVLDGWESICAKLGGHVSLEQAEASFVAPPGEHS